MSFPFVSINYICMYVFRILSFVALVPKAFGIHRVCPAVYATFRFI
jgi:hypothetical protein